MSMSNSRSGATRLRRLDLNLLLALDVLLQERSVVRASQRLSRSQPAVSAMLAHLREFFGDELLRRNGRDVELTPFAAELIAPLRNFTEKAEALIGMQSARKFFDLERTFAVSMSDGVASFLMPTLLKYLEDAAPKVVIRVKSIDQEAADVALERGDTDFIVAPALALSGDKSERYVIEDLYDERLVCIGDRDIINASDVQDIERFSQLPFIAVRFNDASQIPVAETVFENLGIRRNIKLYVPYFQLVPRLIEHSDRIAIVHEQTALSALSQYNIGIFNPPIEIPTLAFKLISHARNSLSLQYQWMRAAIQKACGLEASAP